MIRHSHRFAVGALALLATSFLSASTLHFAGSSQLDDGGRKPEHYPYWSWGTELEKHMPAAHHVRNCAVGGQSTKSFRDSGLWKKLLDGVKAGDFVGIQFGANDQKCSTPFYREKRFAAPDGLFTEILRTWVADVRAKGATPILISHSGRCTFDKSGTRIVDWESAPGLTLGTYTEATRRLAAELRCDFVDMQGLVRSTSERLGRDEALKNYVVSTGLVLGKDGEPSKDTTHPIKSGAELQARLFLEDIRRQGLSVARLFDRATVAATNDFDAAIAVAASAGGGRVIVPRGVWKAGTIRLRDRCDLELAEGAVVECEGVVATGCTNVTISGTGTLRLSDGGVVVLSGCRGVRLRDFTLCGSSVAALQVVSSADVSIRGVTATAGRDVDALTIAGSRDVTVEKCAFSRYDEEILRQEAKEALVRDLRVVSTETPCLRIGVLTDTHIDESRASCEDVARAYRFFRSVGVDAIVNCGDIAHRYNPKGYAYYREIRRETYPDSQTAPRELFVMAGHDSMGFPGGREAAPWTNTYAHVRAALGVDHEMYADVPVKGFHFLVFPQCLDIARAEKMLATACADTPGKPVFVFDHIPAFGTTEGSVSDGCPNRRKLYAKFPQSVVVTGHTHVCLRNPLNLWQGEFVTVGGGCFANWEGETTGAWRGGSRLRHFLVIEAFNDRLVFRRYDLDGGPEEIGAGRPWTVDWPRTGAPVEEPVAAVPAFSPGATLALTNAPGAQGDVEIRFPAAVTPETLDCYRIRVALVAKDGSAKPLSEQDLPAEFVLPKAKRRQVFTDRLNGGLFAPGETYRVSVAPVGFRGERGRELSATWIGKPAARMPLVWLGVPEEARQNVPIELRQGREVRLKLPADIWERVPAGARVRVVADIDFEQADDSIVTFSLYGDKTGGRYPWQVVSPQGNSSLRYAFDATLPKVEQTYSLAFRKGGGARIVIRSVRIETRDPLPVPVGKVGAPRLFFAGDSTLDDHGRSLSGLMQYPNQSWGTTLQAAMVDGCVVRNYARSGASTKSFEASGIWKQLVDDVRAGDFVAIEFGHNDQKRATEFYLKNRWADPKGLFREIVRRWVGEVRAKGATPILLSPICRGTFDAEGKRLVDTTHASDGVCLGSYRDAMRELSEELGCSFVDMNTLTKDLMERLGKEASMQFFVISTGIVQGRDGEPSKDVTHPVKAGAEAFARLFLDDVKARNLPVAALFR